MTKETHRLYWLKDRRAKLSGNGKNIKSPGVLRKLNRQIRNLENK